MSDAPSTENWLQKEINVLSSQLIAANKRAEKLTKDLDELVNEAGCFECDIASALGWDCGGKPMHECVRKLRTDLVDRDAEIVKLREIEGWWEWVREVDKYHAQNNAQAARNTGDAK